MKKRKGIILAVVVACVLSLFFCYKTEKRIKQEVLLSDSEVEKYTTLAQDLSKVNVGNISKILIKGEVKKVSFAFSGNGRVTANYSDDDYKISSNCATYEQIDSSVIVLNKLINLKFDDIYRIEFDNAQKLISIQAAPSGRWIFIVKFSDGKIIEKTLEMTEATANLVFYWKYLIPFLLLLTTVLIIYLLIKKDNKSKKE